MDYIIEKSDELAHHGILGQKWGVRRYQNYDGSYTRAGMKRYNQSLENYEKASDRYKNAKTNYKSAQKSGSSTDTLKTEITNARMRKKEARRQLDKDYAHLKQDKLGDKGKDLYSKGKTITGNATITNALSKVSAMTLSAAAYNYKTDNITRLLQKAGININDKTLTSVLAYTGIGAAAIAGTKKAVDYSQDRKLRAFYSHTSNY